MIQLSYKRTVRNFENITKRIYNSIWISLRILKNQPVYLTCQLIGWKLRCSIFYSLTVNVLRKNKRMSFNDMMIHPKHLEASQELLI